MSFHKFIPIQQLSPYVKYIAVSENGLSSKYKVFPSTGLVLGFQYRGQLSTIKNNIAEKLAAAGVTGVADSYRIFSGLANTGTILVYFTEIGFAHFSSQPANELFNLSISLDAVFKKTEVREIEEKLSFAGTDEQRVNIVEKFLLLQLKHSQIDKLVTEGIRIIYQTKGTIRIKDLNKKLFISQSPFEKRFRKLVGTTPKKFASIVRFNAVLENFGKYGSLTDLSYKHSFFDQAHFIKDFKQYTGNTPENFKQFL